MTFDEKKAYLRRAYRLDRRIRSHVAELEILRSMLGSIGGSAPDGLQHSPRFSGSGETNKLIRAIDLEDQLKREIAEMGQRWKEIHDTIEAVSNIDERLILRLRYIQGYTWDEIGAELHYSRSQVFRIHDAAINHTNPPG